MLLVGVQMWIRIVKMADVQYMSARAVCGVPPFKVYWMITMGEGEKNINSKQKPTL